jgi:anti-sigma-K factor RskA
VSAIDHNRFEDDIGAYLLGALADGEQDAFERHLAGCHVCQDEVDRMRAAADALPRSVEQYDPPPALKAALMEQVYADAPADAAAPATPRKSLAERLGLAGGLRGLTPQLAVAATALVLAVGVVAGYGASQLGGGGGGGGDHDPVGRARSVAAAVDATRVGSGKATLVVPDGGAGAQLRVAAMPQTRTGRVYQVWLQRGGRVEPGPLFSVDENGNGVGAVPGDLDGVKAVLVTRERAGGARQPTEAPVVRAKV